MPLVAQNIEENIPLLSIASMSSRDLPTSAACAVAGQARISVLKQRSMAHSR
jgi:hypothetical protein